MGGDTKVRLHRLERLILKALLEMGDSTTFEIAQKIGVKRDAIEVASLWAAEKGLVTIHTESRMLAELTKEGWDTLNNGLPERRLQHILEKGPINISKLKKRLERLDIAIGWARRRGWIIIEGDSVQLTEKGFKEISIELPEEQIIKNAATAPVPITKENKRVIDELVRRKILRLHTERKKILSLTEKGREVATKVGVSVEVSKLTPELIVSGKWRDVVLTPYDISVKAPTIYPGKKHFMRQVIDYIRRIWLDMGFKEMKGPILDVAFWVFDALYQPQDHPARDLADTFYAETPSHGELPSPEIVDAVRMTHEDGWTTGSTGWGYKWDENEARKCVLRTHTTSLSARTLAKLRDDIENGNIPAKYFSVGRVFRNETLTWKNLAEFYQTDGIVVGDVSFRHLLGYLKEFYNKLGIKKCRFRPAYFPYTEMSVEIEVFDERKGVWVELGGAGIFRPEVVKPLLGKDIPVLAWGPGLERTVMNRYNIEDIRILYMNDLEILRSARLWIG